MINKISTLAVVCIIYVCHSFSPKLLHRFGCNLVMVIDYIRTINTEAVYFYLEKATVLKTEITMMKQQKKDSF